ncbi:MAG: hydroxymethylglutaryl-CoA lyase [Alphaproteobacteria bacterium]|nr:hydroxymethylglutaryl-CoA lyase [Alphaproteobacteria bacterium]
MADPATGETAVEIVEVSPRDGLQNESRLLYTEDKIALVERLAAAGARRIEAASFVNPRRVPQMADGEAVMAGLSGRTRARLIALALNETGLRRAIAAQADEINYVMVASPGFGLRNQNATPEQSAALFETIAPLAHEAGIPLSVTISVAFGDPFDGEVPHGVVAELAARAAGAGADEIALGDTIGVADPWDVRRRLEAVRAAAPGTRLRVHFHDTRGAALANIHASLEAGVRIIDASCGGFGGCPFAPNATGNVATESVVYMLERGGLSTGIDLDALIATARWLEERIGRPAPSLLLRAGGFPSSSRGSP